jgi:hypothetical protein
MKIVKMIDNSLVTILSKFAEKPVALDGWYVGRCMAVVDLVTNRSPRGLPQRNRILSVQCKYSYFIDKF